MNIDYKLLKRQRNTLLDLMADEACEELWSKKYKSSVDGAINLMDALLDEQEDKKITWSEDLIPPCGMYAELLEKAVKKFKIPINEARNRYGNFTIKSGKNEHNPDYVLSAPLYQQLVDWFREKHGKNIYVQHNCQNGKYYGTLSEYNGGGFHEIGMPTGKHSAEGPFENYHEAFNAVLTKAFKLIP